MSFPDLGRVGVIGRWKPFHNGGAVMLESICERAEHVTIGIGSSNKYNVRNPFTAEESRCMIDAYLSKRFSNYSFIDVPDYAHLPEFRDGERWKEYVIANYGELDHFVSGNDYVTDLLKSNYDMIHPSTIVPPEKRMRIKGTLVRFEMAVGERWKSLVPSEVAAYLVSNMLIDRFRSEFGLETIAELAGHECVRHENKLEEYVHTLEV